MNLTFKEAYEIALEAFEELKITSCYDIGDSWIFIAPCDRCGNAVFVPPLQVAKNGEVVDFWNKPFNNCFERGDWLKENGETVELSNK